MNEATAKAVAGALYDSGAFKSRAANGVLRYPSNVKWDGTIDSKHADSTPAMLEQAIENMRSPRRKSMLRYHYTGTAAERKKWAG